MSMSICRPSNASKRTLVIGRVPQTVQSTTLAFTIQDPPSSIILETGPAVSNPSQEGLPSGVVIEIFQWLDLYSLLKCRLVCSGFQSLIDSTTSLQYQIELELAGQQDGSYGDLFTRREMLKIHQERWDGLQWTEVLRVPMMSTFWGLYGGVFAQYGSKTSTLHLKRIPSLSRGIKEKNWVLDLSTLFGEETRMGNFGMDPGQDLLVIIAKARAGMGSRIYLLTLSKGERHPLTSEPCLVPHGLVSGRLQRFYIDIYHDFLSVHLVGGAVLWNWKTGQVLMHVFSYDITSMVFLNERYVLMATMRRTHPELLAVDFLVEPPEKRHLFELENCFIFQFPDVPDPFSEDDIVDNIIIRSNPRSTWGADINPSVPFSTAPQNRVLVVYLLSNHLNKDLSFAILEASFLSLIKTGLHVNNNNFDWSMWGPEHSRILPNSSYSATWISPSHGTRLAMKRYVPHRGILVDVYDFNQLGCRNKRQDSDVETPGNVNVSESSEIIEGRPVCVLAPTRIKPYIFRDQVETKLGYSVITRSVPGEIRSISAMCSEDAVIIVDEAYRMYEICTV